MSLGEGPSAGGAHCKPRRQQGAAGKLRQCEKKRMDRLPSRCCLGVWGLDVPYTRFLNNNKQKLLPPLSGAKQKTRISRATVYGSRVSCWSTIRSNHRSNYRSYHTTGVNHRSNPRSNHWSNHRFSQPPNYRYNRRSHHWSSGGTTWSNQRSKQRSNRWSGHFTGQPPVQSPTGEVHRSNRRSNTDPVEQLPVYPAVESLGG